MNNPLTFSERLLGVALAVLAFAPANYGHCASSMASGLDEGYSAKVLDKAIKTFSPASELGSGKISLRLFIDGDGRYYDCRVHQSSGNQTIDKAFCANLKKASPFGQPPYGQPAEVTLTFIEDKNQPRGKTILEENKSSSQAETTATAEKRKYLDSITRQIRNSVYIPAESPKGTYHPVARIKIDQQGKILDSSIVKSSGDKLVDKYLLQGIKRASKVIPPPAGINKELDLTFSLVR